MTIFLSVELNDNAGLSAQYFYTLPRSQKPSLKLQASQILKEKIWSFVSFTNISLFHFVRQVYLGKFDIQRTVHRDIFL
jgi:hypothetical protein